MDRVPRRDGRRAARDAGDGAARRVRARGDRARPALGAGRAAHVRRLRGAAPLDGAHAAPAARALVLLRPGLLGPGLPAADGLRELALRRDRAPHRPRLRGAGRLARRRGLRPQTVHALDRRGQRAARVPARGLLVLPDVGARVARPPAALCPGVPAAGPDPDRPRPLPVQRGHAGPRRRRVRALLPEALPPGERVLRALAHVQADGAVLLAARLCLSPGKVLRPQGGGVQAVCAARPDGRRHVCPRPAAVPPRPGAAHADRPPAVPGRARAVRGQGCQRVVRTERSRQAPRLFQPGLACHPKHRGNPPRSPAFPRRPVPAALQCPPPLLPRLRLPLLLPLLLPGARKDHTRAAPPHFPARARRARRFRLDGQHCVLQHVPHPPQEGRAHAAVLRAHALLELGQLVAPPVPAGRERAIAPNRGVLRRHARRPCDRPLYAAAGEAAGPVCGDERAGLGQRLCRGVGLLYLRAMEAAGWAAGSKREPKKGEGAVGGSSGSSIETCWNATEPRRPTQAAAFRRHATMPPGVKVVTEAGQLESELRFLLPALTQKESDQTWNGINDALERWKLLTKEGGAYKLHDAYFACLRRIQAHVVSAILSDRSKLSRTAVELVECLAVLFRQNFEPFAEVFVTAVLKLSTRANRVFVSSATQCLRTVVEHCPVPGLLEAFLEALQNKNKTMRACAAEAAAACVEHTPLPLLQDHVDEIEQFVATAVEDAESSVRDWARSCFALYAERFASRLEGFQARLSPKARKYLAVAATEQTKRTSVFDARLQAQRARDKRTVGMGSFLAGSDGAKDPHADVYGVGPAARLQLSKPLEGVGAGKSLPADPSAGALGAARRKARPSVAPGLDDRDASDARRSESSANTSSASINVKDVLDKSGSTIANALLHAQRVPKVPVDTASQASRGPVRRLAGNGAQRVAVGAKPDAEKAISEVKVQENSAHLAPADPTPAPKPALTDAKARDQTEKARFGTLPEAPSTFTERPRSAIPVLSLTVHEGSTRAGGRGVDDSFDHLHGTSVKPALASFRAPLWSVRLQAFENLASRLKDLGTDGDLPAAKTADILDTGLDDTHTKVALAAMECLKAFLERHPADAKLLDLVLGKVIGSLRASSASQSRSSATNAANDVLDILKRTCDADVLLASSLNILSSSEWSKVSRVRMGALDLAASLIQDHPALLLRAQVMRSVVHKLAAFVPDVDATSSRRLRSLLLTLEASSSESFFAAATSLKPSERKLLRSILIKDITDWDAKEKHAFAKLHATDAAPQASESILYPETTSLAAPPLPRSPTKADTQETLVLSSDQRSISDAKLLADEPCVQETEIDRPAALESEHSFIVDIPEQPSANVISNVFEARPSPPADVSLIAFDKSLHLAANGLPSHAMDQEDQDNDFSRDLIAFDVSIIARVAVPLLEEEPPKDLFELGSPFTGDVDSGNRELANAGSAPEAPLDHELPTAEDVRDISEGNATSAALTVAASEGASLVATADPATTIPDRELDAMGVEGEDVELTENVPEARFQHIDDSSLEPDLDSLPPMHYEGKPSVASSPVTSPFLNDSGLEAPLSSVLPEQQVHTAVSETEFPGPSMQDLGEDPCLGDAAVQLELTAVAEKDRVDVQALEELVAQLQASLAEQTEITETLRKDLDDRASEHERAREAASEALAALEQLRERHQADFAAEFSRLSAEHKTLVDDLRAAYEARIAALSQPVEPVSEVPELLATALRELEMAMASAASDKQLFAARIAQLEAEASIRDQYLAEVEKRAAVEKTELEAIWRVRVAEANQRNTEMAELLQDAETAYEQLHRAYAAAVAMPEESMGVNETEEAEDEVIGSPDHAMELLTCGDIAVGAFSYLLTISQPIDLTGETLALICDMAKRAETDGLTLCKCLLLLQDSIAINPAVVENNEEIVIDSIALGACAVPCVASQFVPDIRLCLERLVETTANAIVPHRLSYSVHYILSLDFASTTPYVQSLFTKLVLLMKDTDGERLASRIASMIMPALRSSDIELRKTAFESLGQLHTHVGQTLLRELAQAMSVKPDPMLRHLVRKRLGVSEEDLALDETF